MWARNHCHLWFWQWVRTWAGGISSTFLSSSSLWRKVFSSLTFLSVFALVFLFSCSSMRSSIVPSRRTNLGTSASILFLQKAARLLPSTVKYYLSCLWLDERCIFTVVRFSDWFVVYFGRILRGLFFMCKSQYVWNKCIFCLVPLFSDGRFRNVQSFSFTGGLTLYEWVITRTIFVLKAQSHLTLFTLKW